jgi:hypothetical protein
VAEPGILTRLDLEEIVAMPGRELRLFRPRDARPFALLRSYRCDRGGRIRTGDLRAPNAAL